MDTIETSNLNRQFLFRKHHVGESKAKVAAEAVKRFRPDAKIQADQVRHTCVARLLPGYCSTLSSSSCQLISGKQASRPSLTCFVLHMAIQYHLQST